MRLIVLFAASVFIGGPIAAGPLRDPVVNGGFELGLYGFEGHVNAAVTKQNPHTGSQCVQIDGAKDTNSYVQQTVDVDAGREYELSVWHRCEGIDRGADCKAYYNVWSEEDVLSSEAPLQRIHGTHDWQRQRARIRLPAGADRISIILQLYKAEGRVWFDDVSLLPIATIEERSRWQWQAKLQAASVQRAVERAREAPEIVPGVGFMRDGGDLFLCNERLALTFHGASGRFALKSLVDLKTRREFVMPGHQKDLFRIELRPRSKYVYRSWVVRSGDCRADRCSARMEVEEGRAILRLRWNDVAIEGQPAVHAEATVELAAEGLSRWRLSVEGTSNGMGIWIVDFPILGGIGASGKGAAQSDYVAVPIKQGVRWEHPRQTVSYGPGMADYPSGGKTMQFEAYCIDDEEGGGLYLATEDSDVYRKSIVCRQRGNAFSWRLRNYPADMGRVNRYEMPYCAAIGVFSGGWWDAAAIYREWALRQPWSSAGPMRDRPDTPDWFKQLGVWAQGDLPGQKWEDMKPQVARVRGFQEDIGSPLGFHAYLWQHGGVHDRGYPGFLPAKPGARRFFEKLRDAGVRVVPYLNMYSADAGGESWREKGLGELALRPVGGGTYGDPEHLVPMCPATERWRNLVVGEYGRVLDALPVDGLYLDQLTGHPFMCFDGEHGHPIGGGRHFYEGMRKITEDIDKAMGEKCPQGILFAEGVSEGYNDVLDGLLTWSQLDPARQIPLYQAVYADRIIRFGLFMGRPDLWGDSCGYYSKLAWTFTTGEQLGWVMFGILRNFDDPKYAPQRKYLAELVACRRVALDFLCYGRLMQTPELGQFREPVKWDDWSTPREGLLPPVLCQVWRAPDGRIGFALANWTAEVRRVALPVGRYFEDAKGAVWRVCRAGNWSEARPVEERAVSLQIAGRSAAVVEVEAEQRSPAAGADQQGGD